MLADDNDFKGIVICDMLAPYLRRSVDHQREFYNYPAGPDNALKQRLGHVLRISHSTTIELVSWPP